MADLDLLTEIHGDVKYIKTTLEDHIRKDDNLAKEFIRPLWESHQQRKGAAKLAGVLYTITGGLIVGFLDTFLKWPK